MSLMGIKVLASIAVRLFSAVLLLFFCDLFFVTSF